MELYLTGMPSLYAMFYDRIVHKCSLTKRYSLTNATGWDGVFTELHVLRKGQ